MHAEKTKPFETREQAGGELAKRLAKFAESPDLVILALPNGGVPVGTKIASLLHKPFDVMLMENITAPECDGKSLGAITAGGVRVLDCAMIDRLHMSQTEVNQAVLQACQNLARREKNRRRHSHPLEIADHTVILVADGMTPCATMRDAIRLLRRQHADHVIVAMPLACRHTACELRFEADEVVTLAEAENLRTDDDWSKQHHRTTDTEDHRLLHTSASEVLVTKTDTRT